MVFKVSMALYYKLYRSLWEELAELAFHIWTQQSYLPGFSWVERFYLPEL